MSQRQPCIHLRRTEDGFALATHLDTHTEHNGILPTQESALAAFDLLTQERLRTKRPDSPSVLRPSTLVGRLSAYQVSL